MGHLSSIPAGGTRPIRVLVVEDDARVRRALVGLLASDPRVTVAGACGEAQTARKLAAAVRPDVGLVDLLLPDLEAGLALVADLPGAGVPVVAMSVRDGLRDQARAAGASDFLQKDGDLERFVTVVVEVGRASGPAE